MERVKNYEEFKQLFIREDGKRKNRVILDMWLDKAFNEYIKTQPMLSVLKQVRTMADLFTLCDYFVSRTSTGAHIHNIFDRVYRSELYMSDGNGLCVDGDFRGYRYYNVERQAIFKMKIGKMYKHFIDGSEFGKHLPESVKLYMCEEMTTKWMAYTQSKCANMELYVDDKFHKIYDSEYYDGDFHSCMTDGDNYHFYEDAVDAQAAYLMNGEGRIVARCVIYTNAKDEDGKVWRLAERQYSANGDEVYKRLLIQSLINGGHIDAYKKVGAGCHDPLLWLDVNDNPLPNPKFSIRCVLSNGDYISYQDSFKWYDYSKDTAYNYNPGGLDELLSSTDETFEGGAYDSWHEEYTDDELVEVWSSGHRYMCSEERLGDFRWVEGACEYHHEDDVVWCECCDVYVLNDYAYYSEITDEYYCCEECMNDAEAAYSEEE